MTTKPAVLFKDQLSDLHTRAEELSNQLDAVDAVCEEAVDTPQPLDKLTRWLTRAIELRHASHALYAETNEITSRAPTATFEESVKLRPALSEYSRQVFQLSTALRDRADTLFVLVDTLHEECQRAQAPRFGGLRRWWNGLFGLKAT